MKDTVAVESTETAAGMVEEPGELGVFAENNTVENGISNEEPLYDSPCRAYLEL